MSISMELEIFSSSVVFVNNVLLSKLADDGFSSIISSLGSSADCS